MDEEKEKERELEGRGGREKVGRILLTWTKRRRKEARKEKEEIHARDYVLGEDEGEKEMKRRERRGGRKKKWRRITRRREVRRKTEMDKSSDEAKE